MLIETTFIKDILIITPKVITDYRGYFMESYTKKLWQKHLSDEFVQENESLSKKGILRGLHFQNPPFAQAKLIRVTSGSVLDVVVDLRKSSPTYGQHFKIKLSAKNKKQLYIPIGFAHGFLSLKNNSIVSYKCSQYYTTKAEDNLLWNDLQLNIDWGINEPILSNKDKKATIFANYKSPFL